MWNLYATKLCQYYESYFIVVEHPLHRVIPFVQSKFNKHMFGFNCVQITKYKI